MAKFDDTDPNFVAAMVKATAASVSEASKTGGEEPKQVPVPVTSDDDIGLALALSASEAETQTQKVPISFENIDKISHMTGEICQLKAYADHVGATMEDFDKNIAKHEREIAEHQEMIWDLREKKSICEAEREQIYEKIEALKAKFQEFLESANLYKK